MKINASKFILLSLVGFYAGCDHPETSDAPGTQHGTPPPHKSDDARPTATSNPNSSDPKTGDPSTKPSLACPDYENVQSGLNYSSNASFNLSSEDLLTLYENGNRQVLCKILGDAHTTVVTMQFSGIYCLACQEQARMFTHRYATTDLGKNVKHVIVFIDAPDGGFDESEFDSFINKYAVNSFKKFDSLRRFYNKLLHNPTTVKFGAGFAFNAFGDQYFQESAEGANFEGFVSQVQKLIPQKVVQE